MEKKLYRNEHDKIIAGVCSGLAEYFDMEVTWMRIIFVFAAIFGFSGFLIYIILWIVIPSKPFNPNFSSFTDYRVYDDKGYPAGGTSTNQPTPMPPYMSKGNPKQGNGRLIAGLILIGLGGYFLLDEFDIVPDWFDVSRLWPVVIIILGVLLISRAGKKNTQTGVVDDKPESAVADERPADGNTTTTSTTTTTTDSDQPLT